MNQPNYTMVYNSFIDNMHKFTGAQVKVFLAISRKTIGWHKTADRISYSQLTEITGITHRITLQKAINELEKEGYISVSGDKKTGYTYDLNIEGSSQSEQQKWSASSQSERDTAETSSLSEHTKERSKEKNIINSDQHKNEIIRVFYKLHGNKYEGGIKVSAKEAGALIRLSNQFGFEEVKKKLEEYYRKDYWFTTTGRSVFGFIKFYNQIIIGEKKEKRLCDFCGAEMIGTSTLCKKCGNQQ